MKYTCHQIAKWFEITQTKRNWPSIDGYVWEVDFKKCIVFPRHNSSLQKQKSSVIGLAEGPIMEISEIDTDIIQRLFAKRGAMADLVRSKLNGLANEENKENKKLNIWVSQLGEACQDINEWFSEMSIIHNWPKINSQWQYRASFSENKVYLEHV
ncbi:MAG: hypothetical protein GWN62_04665 [Aliifodinibius sp.]|nr:hypothetical protein [Fodinibius sp.]